MWRHRARAPHAARTPPRIPPRSSMQKSGPPPSTPHPADARGVAEADAAEERGDGASVVDPVPASAADVADGFGVPELADLAAVQSILELSSDAHVLVDDEGRILWASRLMRARLGLSSDELDTLTIGDVDPGFTRARFAALFARARRERVPPFESLHRRRDGSTFAVEVTATAVRIGREARLLGSARDISERKAAEAERERLLAAEQLARARAEAAAERLRASEADLAAVLDR